MPLQNRIGYDSMNSPGRVVWTEFTYRWMARTNASQTPRDVRAMLILNVDDIHEHAIVCGDVVVTIVRHGALRMNL